MLRPGIRLLRALLRRLPHADPPTAPHRPRPGPCLVLDGATVPDPQPGAELGCPPHRQVLIQDGPSDEASVRDASRVRGECAGHPAGPDPPGGGPPGDPRSPGALPRPMVDVPGAARGGALWLADLLPGSPHPQRHLRGTSGGRRGRIPGVPHASGHASRRLGRCEPDRHRRPPQREVGVPARRRPQRQHAVHRSGYGRGACPHRLRHGQFGATGLGRRLPAVVDAPTGAVRPVGAPATVRQLPRKPGRRRRSESFARAVPQ